MTKALIISVRPTVLLQTLSGDEGQGIKKIGLKTQIY